MKNFNQLKTIKNLKIKNSEKVENRIFLAPMAEINDIAFRLLCKKAGCCLTWTGLIHPRARQELFFKDKPVCQLFCKNSKEIKKFIKKHNKKVSGWDFNLGCPAINARKYRFGSYMDWDLKNIEKILKEIRKYAGKKKFVCVKIRKSKYSFKILKIAEKYCDAIAIHPRTKEQGYSGIPDKEFALKLKEKTFLPVIYSGNVNEDNYKELLKKFDYLMIGREVIGDPCIFSRIQNKRKNKCKINFMNYLKLAKKYKLPFRQIKFQSMNFTKKKRNAKKLRLEIFKIKDKAELKKFGKKEKL
ncbi:MAG: tRNA-dihydrouridine synthase [Nanoarchaeota archaeon]